MGFIDDFWAYCKRYEISRNHAIWSALGLLGAVVNRKVYLRHGDLKFHSNLFICLVSDQGTGKSVSKDFAEALFREVCPEIPVGPSQQSREDIVKFMSSDQCLNSYLNENQQPQELRCYVFFIDELKNFLSYNPPGMIAFLTNIYDRNFFDASTLKRGLEVIQNPCINILACENPDWIVRNLKYDVISGGFSRRFVMVYEISEPPPQPKIVSTPESDAIWERMKKSLMKIKYIAGECKLSPEAEAIFIHWYIKNRSHLPDDKIIRGYQRTKHVQLFKVCMLLTVSGDTPSLVITPKTFELGLAVLDAVDENMPKLSVAAGRNELAVPTERILEILEANGGMVEEKVLAQRINKDLDPSEQLIVMRFLCDTDQIRRRPVKINGETYAMVLTKKRFDTITKDGGIK